MALQQTDTSIEDNEQDKKNQKGTSRGSQRQSQSDSNFQSSGGGKGSKSSHTGVSGIVTSEYTIYSLPIAFPIWKALGLKIVAPFIDDGSDVLIGHTTGALTLTGKGKVFGASLELGAVFPTAESPIAEEQSTQDPYASGSFLIDTHPIRILLSSSFIDKRPAEGIDRGDISTYFLGIDVPLISVVRLYISGYRSHQRDDELTEELNGNDSETETVASIDSELITTDASLGFVFPFFVDLRVGVTVPVETTSEIYSNDDRETSVDFGLRLDI